MYVALDYKGFDGVELLCTYLQKYAKLVKRSLGEELVSFFEFKFDELPKLSVAHGQLFLLAVSLISS